MTDLVSSDDLNNISLTNGVDMPSEELKEWQMVLMTSADPLKKQEAFRRIMLSKLDEDTKRNYCFQALSDSTDDLQKDAFKALAALGGKPELLSVLQNMLSERESVRSRAIQQLPQLMEKQDSWIITFIVTSLLEKETDKSVLKKYYEVLQQVNRHLLEDQLPQLINALLVAPEEVECFARMVLKGWATSEKRGVLLLNEAVSHGLGVAGEWLLPLAFETGLRSEKLRQAMIAQMLNHRGQMDPTGIGNLIIQLGADCLEELMAGYGKCEHSVYVMYVMSQILDKHEVDSEMICKILDFALDELRSGSRDVLSTLLSFSFGKADIPKEYQEKWVKELIYSRNQMTSDHLLNELDYQIISAGEVAAATLAELFEKGDESEERLYALKLLVRLVPDIPEELLKVADSIIEKIKKNILDRGDLLLALGQLWKREVYPADRREREVEENLMSLWRKSRTPERFEAMARALPLLDAPMANRVIFALLDLLETKLPELEKQSLKRKVDLIDGAHLEQQLLMAGLNGLIGALKRDDILPELFDQIKNLLYGYWEKEVSEQVVLGPGAMPSLICAFEVIVENYDNDREELLEMMTKNLDRVSVLQAVPRLWPYLDNRHLDRIAKYLIEAFKTVRQMEFEELNTILEVTRCMIENATERHSEHAERVLLRLRGLKRHKLKQINSFLNSELRIPSFLN